MEPIWDPLQGLWVARGQGAVRAPESFFVYVGKKYWPRAEELINYSGRRPEMRRGALWMPLGAPILLFVPTARIFFVPNILFLSPGTKKDPEPHPD